MHTRQDFTLHITTSLDYDSPTSFAIMVEVAKDGVIKGDGVAPTLVQAIKEALREAGIVKL